MGWLTRLPLLRAAARQLPLPLQLPLQLQLQLPLPLPLPLGIPRKSWHLLPSRRLRRH